MTSPLSIISCTSCNERIITGSLHEFLPEEVTKFGIPFGESPATLKTWGIPMIVNCHYCNHGNEDKQCTSVTMTKTTMVAKATKVTMVTKINNLTSMHDPTASGAGVVRF
jgi:hypothetical protein